MKSAYGKFVAPAFALLLLLTSCQLSALAQERPRYYEVGVWGAETTKATTRKPGLGFDVSFGLGRDRLTAAYNHQDLGNYALGYGQTLNPSIIPSGYGNMHP